MKLEPDDDELRHLFGAATDHVLRFLREVDVAGMGGVGHRAEQAAALNDPLPEEGRPIDQVLAQLFDDIIPCSLNTSSGGHLSYVPNGGIVHAGVADLITDATNRYVAYWGAAPGMAQLELNVIRWLCDMVGYPEEAGGVLTSGGSIGNLMALVTARRERLPADFLSGTIYASEQMHHSVTKAAVVAGFAPDRVRAVESDEAFRLSPARLREAVERDRRDGCAPFFVVATAGTTNTGAIDPLNRIADVAGELGLWLHVDAAYGGFFALTERGRDALAGIGRADSIVLDPHKSLFLPFGTGSLIVRDRDVLRRAHSVHSDYITEVVTSSEAAGAVDFADLSPEMSRECRGLRLWLPLQLVGARAFRCYLDEKLDLAIYATERLRELPGVDVIAAPVLSTIAFRVTAPGASGEALDTLNRRVLDGVNRRGRVHLSGTVLRSRFAIRICVLSFRTHRTHLDACLEDLRASIGEILTDG